MYACNGMLVLTGNYHDAAQVEDSHSPAFKQDADAIVLLRHAAMYPLRPLRPYNFPTFHGRIIAPQLTTNPGEDHTLTQLGIAPPIVNPTGSAVSE